MKAPYPLALVILFVFSLCGSASAEEAKFVDLFDGESLDGFEQKGGKAKYRVEDGCIVGTTVPQTPNSFLCTKKHYGDFILVYEFKVDAAMNSGVQIRSHSIPEYRKGRGLFIGTTNLDAGRPVIWNIGALANSGDGRALRLFRDILLASASVPGAFPPVLFEVEAGGEAYDEMHVDGGVGSQVFAYPPSVSLKAIGATLGVPVKRTVYVVRNAKLAASYQAVKPRLGQIAARSLVVLIKHQGIGDVFRIYALAQRDNVDFRLAFIPPEFDVELKEPFDQNYMRALYDLGYEIGRSGDFWLEKPPGVIP